MNFKDETGKKYGLLRVVRLSDKRPTTNGWRFWHCVCDCGNEHVVAGGHLRNGHVQSCGCMRRKSDERN